MKPGSTVVTTPVNVNGVEERDENRDKAVAWHMAMEPGKHTALLDARRGRLR